MPGSRAPKAEEPAPWDRQDGESAKAFAAFHQYMMLPPPSRTIVALVREDLSSKQLYKWSTRYSWRKRATAWDHNLAEVERREVEKKVAQLAHKRVAAATRIIDRATKDLVGDENGAGAWKRHLTPNQIARLLEAAIRLGEPNAAKDGGKVTLENVLIAVAGQRTDPTTVTD